MSFERDIGNEICPKNNSEIVIQESLHNDQIIDIDKDSVHSNISILNSIASDRSSSISSEKDFDSSICFNKSILVMLQCEERENIESTSYTTHSDKILREPIQDDMIIEYIDVDMVQKIINNDYSWESCKYTIIDVRFPYEYRGGHLRGALNLFTPFKVLRYLFASDFKSSIANEDEGSYLNELFDQIMKLKQYRPSLNLIFHCEFSSVRGPRMAAEIRCIDRIVNLTSYPKLFFPKIFVMTNGYKEFFSRYRTFCQPRSYVKMDPEDHMDSILEKCPSAMLRVSKQDTIANKNKFPKRKDRKMQIDYFREIVSNQMAILSDIKARMLAEKAMK